MAGAQTPDGLTVDELCRQIRAIGREPVERTTTYEVVPCRAGGTGDTG
jgi:2-iminoacetate synthase ThiH